MLHSWKKKIVLWTTLTITLIGFYFLSIKIEIGTNFFILLNGINITFIVLFIIFHKQIKSLYESCLKSFNAIQQSSNNRFIIHYSHESKIGKALILIVTLIAIYTLPLAFWAPDNYELFIKEDGIVEYGSALCWFLAALTLIISTLKTKKNQTNSNHSTLPYILLISFFVVCGGEEISWGQRIFNLNTPELLKTVNVQNEITLHNIGSISVFSNAFFLLTILYFWVVPFILSKYSNMQTLVHHYGLPLPNKYVSAVYSISFSIWLLIGIRFGTLGFHPFSFYEENYYTQMDDEIFEFLAAYSFLCFSVMESLKTMRLKPN